MEPERIQLSRRKGFRLQTASRDLNGLPAVVVARPTKWGNPFGERLQVLVAFDGQRVVVAGMSFSAADLFDLWLRGRLRQSDAIDRLHARRFRIMSSLHDLRGKNLACWCPAHGGVSCHADVLLEMANKPVCTGMQA